MDGSFERQETGERQETDQGQKTGRSNDWLYTPKGDKRGYIQPHALKELWFHTGTACNLACPFCLEGSKPGDTRLGLVKFEDAKPFIDEAIDMGVEQFSFTGGEPFIAKDIIKILLYAAEHRPCMVLTNATAPLLSRLAQVELLQKTKYPVSFRVSLDHFEADKHDEGRGKGSFDAAVKGIKELLTRGFNVSIARHMTEDEDSAAVDAIYHSLVGDMGFDTPPRIVAFPEFSTPFSEADVPQITENCMTEFHTEAGRRDFMCAFSKMVVKQDGKMRVYACTLVDDNTDYDLGGTLDEAMKARVMLGHHRCYSCFAYGASCSEA
jgi:sulfatase maturation enzyme AslB (radical SAM superfamily)